MRENIVAKIPQNPTNEKNKSMIFAHARGQSTKVVAAQKTTDLTAPRWSLRRGGGGGGGKATNALRSLEVLLHSNRVSEHESRQPLLSGVEAKLFGSCEPCLGLCVIPYATETLDEAHDRGDLWLVASSNHPIEPPSGACRVP
jgi:hypothetical protein